MSSMQQIFGTSKQWINNVNRQQLCGSSSIIEVYILLVCMIYCKCWYLIVDAIEGYL